MEALSKILDFIGRYAWAVFITAGFVLFVPDDAAKQIGLLELRQSFKGPLWVVLILTLALFLGSAFQYLDKKLLDGWLKGRRTKKVREDQEKLFVDTLALRLNSLDLNECMWIKYCLFHTTQTLSAEMYNRTAQSLKHKGIVTQGSGDVLDLPFHIPDRVWRYLLEHQTKFLSETERGDARFPSALDNFRKSLWNGY